MGRGEKKGSNRSFPNEGKKNRKEKWKGLFCEIAVVALGWAQKGKEWK